MSRGERLLRAWTARVVRHRRATLALLLPGTLLLALWASLRLGVDMDRDAMIDEDLPHRQRWEAFEAAFPVLADPLIVLVEADGPRQSAEAARLLAERLKRRTDLFEQVLLDRAGTFFERHGLLYLAPDELDDVIDRLAGAQPYLVQLARDPTVRGLFGLLGDAVEAVDEGEVPPERIEGVLEGLAQATEAELAGAPAQPWLTPRLVGEPLRGEAPFAVVLVQPALQYTELNPAQEAIDTIHEAARAAGLPARGVRVRVTGDLALTAEEMELASAGAVTAGVLAFVLVTVILLAGLRSLRMVLAVCATLLVGLAWTAAFATWAVGHLNMVSVAFAVMSIGLGVDFGIHFCARYGERRRAREDLAPALAGTAADVGEALALCALTTAISFYAFGPTDFAGIAELGMISGTGILLSLAATLTLLPALLAVGSPPYHRARRLPAPRWFLALLRLPARRPGAIRAGAAALGVASLAALPWVRFEGNPLALRVPNAESVTAFQDLLAQNSLAAWTLHALAADLEAAERLADDLESLPTVERAVTLADYVPSDQDEKLAMLADAQFLLGPMPALDGDPAPLAPEEALRSIRAFVTQVEATLAGGTDPALREPLRAVHRNLTRWLGTVDESPAPAPLVQRMQTLLVGPIPAEIRRLQRALEAGPVTLDTLPPELLGVGRTADGRVRVEVLPRSDLDSDAELAAFVDTTRRVAPGLTGIAVNVVEAERAVVRALQEALALAGVAITLLLLLVWRSWRHVLTMLAPLSLALLLLLASTVVFSMPLNFANVLVLPLVLGIGIDTGVHLLHRLRAGTRPERLLRTSTTGAALLSALTTLASFGTLGLSPHPGMAGMGRLLTLGVVIMLGCNLVVLPALAERPRREPA